MQNLALVLTVAVLMAWCAGVIHPAAIGLRGKKRAYVGAWGFGATLLAVVLSEVAPIGMWDISDVTTGLIIIPLLVGWPVLAVVKLIGDVLASRRTPRATTSVPVSGAPPVATDAAPAPMLGQSNNAPPAQAPKPVQKPIAKPRLHEPSKKSRRAIDTGWSRGRISFEYVDANGDWSMRTVTVHSVSSSRIKGECHTRRAERTFLLDRIEGDIVDLDTGEILRPRDWARQHS